MALDLVSFNAALKSHYTSDKVENLVYMDHPFLAMVPKMEDFGGANLPIPIITANPNNRSVNFQKGQAGVSTTAVQSFILTRVKDYSFAFLDNETMEASEGNANAFMEAATTEIDGAINALTRSISQKLYRSGFGVLGKIAGSVAGSTLSLAASDEIVNFEVGMRLVFASTVGSSGLRASGAVATVQTVDRSAGTMTVSPALSTITGVQVGDYVFQEGDRQDSATPVRTAIAGLEAWLPSAAPTSTPFFGVDRSVDTTRLGGLRYDATGVPIEEALIEGASRVAREGGTLSHYFMSYSQFSQLEKALGSKVQYVDVKVSTDIGFRTIMVQGPKGSIKIVADQDCQADKVWGLQMNVWKLYSLGKAVKVLDSDGLKMLRQANADGVEVRYGFYGNLGCRAPGWNINITVSPPQSLS